MVTQSGGSKWTIRWDASDKGALDPLEDRIGRLEVSFSSWRKGTSPLALVGNLHPTRCRPHQRTVDVRDRHMLAPTSAPYPSRPFGEMTFDVSEGF
jgi:hypothetical protein